MLFGCDQIIDRSLEKLSKTKNNESILTNKESSLKSLGDSNKENSIKKPEEKKIIKEGISKDKSKELKKRYDYYLEKFEANKKANPDKAGKYIENNKNFEEIEKKYGAENEEYKTLNTKIYNAKIQKKFHPTKTYIAEKLGYKITDEENNKYRL